MRPTFDHDHAATTSPPDHGGSPRPLGATRWGRSNRLHLTRFVLAAFAATFVLVACGDPIVPPPAGNTYQRLLGTAAISGLQVKVSYNPAVYEFIGFTGTQAGVLARAYDDGSGNVTIGLVATGNAMSGQLLRLNWKGPEDGSVPRILTVAAYDAALDPLANVVTLGDIRPMQAGLGTATLAVSAADHSAAQAGLGGSLTADAAALELSENFADYRLGDVNKSGAVDVLDALTILALANGSPVDPDDFTLYHGDVSGDDAVDVEDVEMALAKAIDPTVPAHLVVKPSRLTYLDLNSGVPVLVGNGGSQPLSGLTFTGQNFSGTSFAGSSTQPLSGQSAVYHVTSAPNDANGVLTVALGSQEASVAVGNIVILVAGQSNAQGSGGPMLPDLQTGTDWPEVRALGNDYVWKPAVEALDNGLGQLDMISFDSNSMVSAGVQLGRLLNGHPEYSIDPTDRYVYLIPASRGASRLTPRTSGADTGSGWHISPGDLAGTDRGTLFGSAAYRGLVSSGDRAMPAEAGPNQYDAEGGPVTAVYWYQGESDSSESTLRSSFAGYTADVFTAFEDHFTTGAGKPVVIYAQLAPYGYDENIDPSTNAAIGEDLRQMDIAERQRRMEEGAYAGSPYLNPQANFGTARANTHMVVTNDLPRSDRIHLSAEGQMMLAERIALAYQEHYMGLDVDGTGPRVTALSRSGSVVTVTFDRDVDQTSVPGPNGYSGYFSAWSGTPVPSSLSAGYGETNQVTITDVRRHPTNPRAVQVTLASNPATIYLRYMRPHENTFQSAYVQDVVRGADSGLPLPSFGPLKVN